MAAQVCKNGVLYVFRVIYSFQFRIKMHGLNEFLIIYDHVWAKENILCAAHNAIISIFIQIKIFILYIITFLPRAQHKNYLNSIRKHLKPIKVNSMHAPLCEIQKCVLL